MRPPSPVHAGMSAAPVRLGDLRAPVRNGRGERSRLGVAELGSGEKVVQMDRADNDLERAVTGEPIIVLERGDRGSKALGAERQQALLRGCTNPPVGVCEQRHHVARELIEPRLADPASRVSPHIEHAVVEHSTEELDRVLAHPELELPALGSDSLAGRDGDRARPRLARNGSACPRSCRTRRRSRAGPTSSSSASTTWLAAALEPPPAASSSTSRERHRLATPPLRRSGTASPIRPPASACGATGCPSSSRPGRLIANPGCYATAVLLALAPLADAIDPTASSSTRSPASPAPGARSRPRRTPAHVLENLTPTGSARTSTRRRSRRRSASRSASSPTCCP